MIIFDKYQNTGVKVIICISAESRSIDYYTEK
jgi:hypothetical protein